MSDVKIEIHAGFVREAGESLEQAIRSECDEITEVLNAIELVRSGYCEKLELLNKVRRSAQGNNVKIEQG